MKVSELLEQLKDVNPELYVITEGCDCLEDDIGVAIVQFEDNGSEQVMITRKSHDADSYTRNGLTTFRNQENTPPEQKKDIGTL